MTPDEQGRFCGSCQQIVVDYTAMSDKELLDHISKTAGQHACGRFTSHQLNREITITTQKRRFTWAYVWNFLLATFLVTKSYAQEQPVAPQKPDVQLPTLSPTVGTFAMKHPEAGPSKEISGTIIDEVTKEPIEGATVMIKGTSKGAVSDSLGRFKLVFDSKKPVTLEVIHTGYMKRTLKIDVKKSPHNVTLTITQEEMVMGKWG